MITLLYYHLNLAYESLQLVQNSGNTSDIGFPNPVTEKPPGCLSFAAVQEEMFCFAMLSCACMVAIKSGAK
jgi:hypothetical protein